MLELDRGQESKSVRRAKGSGEQKSQESKGVRRAKGSGEQKGQESKSIRKAKGLGEEMSKRAIGSGELWRIKRIEISFTSPIKSFILHLHLHSAYFSRTHPPIPLYCRIREWD